MSLRKEVGEPTQGVLQTSTHLSLLTVHSSDTCWTVVPKKAAAVAKTTTGNLIYIKNCIQIIVLSNFEVLSYFSFQALSQLLFFFTFLSQSQLLTSWYICWL